MPGRFRFSDVFNHVKGSHAGCDVLPIDQVIQEVRQVNGTFVAEVNVVRVLPDIAAQKRGLAEAKWIHTVFGLCDFKTAVCVFDQPAPTRAELTCARSGELGLELIYRAKAFAQCCFKL